MRYEYRCENCGVIEIVHGMTEEFRTVCPTCGKEGLVLLISGGGGFIIKGKEANQYNDIRVAKMWRDKNGDLHPVTPGDGRATSPTVSSKQTASPEQINAKKKRDAKARNRQRGVESYNRFLENAKRAKSERK